GHALSPDEHPARAEQRGARRVEEGVERRQRCRKRAGFGWRRMAEKQVADDQHDRERDPADHDECRTIVGRRRAHGEITRKARAARNMRAVANQPSRLSHGPFACSPMMARLLPTSMTSRSSGGARSPLTTADRNSMRIVFVPARFSAMPATTAP